MSWKSSKQTCIARLTMEAEFVTCSAAVQEAIWLRRFMGHLGVIGREIGPIRLYCDSQAAIAYIKDAKYHCRMKYIGTKHNFVRDMIAQKEITLQYITTHEMVADPMTKLIPRDVFVEHVKSLVLRRL